MASVVDICNLALANLGDAATVTSIDPPEGSVQAEKCAQFYPVARDALLEMHPWSFAVKRVVLADLGGTPPTNWEYRYARPADCLHAIAVYPEEPASEWDTQPFVQEMDGTTRSILTNAATATLKYIARVTETTTFSPTFVVALSWYLAYLLAMPITRNPDAATAAYNGYVRELANAKRQDAMGQKARDYVTADGKFMPPAIQARL